MLRKIFSLLLVACLVLPAFAQVDTLWQKANTLYTEGKYAEAAELFLQVEKSGKAGVALYYNTANSYYKLGELGKAILYYERALKLEPDDEDTLYNLELAKQQTVDKIEPVPQFFLVAWMDAIRHSMGVDAWAITGVALFCIVLALVLVITLSRSVVRKKVAFFLACVLLLLSIVSTYIAVSQKIAMDRHSEAIIFVPVSSIKASPDSAGVDLFVLHEGTKVTILEAIGDWKKVKTADGKQGWIQANSIEPI